MENYRRLLFLFLTLTFSFTTYADELEIHVIGSSNPEISDPFPAPNCNPTTPCTLRSAIITANRFLQNPYNTAHIFIDGPEVVLSPLGLESEDASATGDLDINFLGLILA